MVAVDAETLKLIRGQSLRSAVCKHLEEMILNGNIAPGERINESYLSKKLDVSRGPIREACRQLEKYGLVEMKANRGTFVTDIQINEVLELIDIRATLEAMAIEKATEKIADEDFKALEETMDRMQACAESNDLETYWVAHLEFHRLIILLSDNQNLIQLIDSIAKKISLYRKRLFYQPQALTPLVDANRDILDTLKKRNAKKASGKMKKHILRGLDMLRINEK